MVFSLTISFGLRLRRLARQRFRSECLDGDAGIVGGPISASRSKSSVRPASIASAVAFERRITSTVFRPTTGTSKRMSWRGLLTFTTTSAGRRRCARRARWFRPCLPWLRRPRRRGRGSPPSGPGRARRSGGRFRGRRRCRRLRDASGARRVSTPGAGTSGPRNLVESTSSMPSSSSTRATAPISESVFFAGSENSNFASLQSGRIELKILLCFTCPAITACFTPS